MVSALILKVEVCLKWIKILWTNTVRMLRNY
jgi:hypothetical protein